MSIDAPVSSPSVEIVGAPGVFGSINGVYELVLVFENGVVQPLNEGRPRYDTYITNKHKHKIHTNNAIIGIH